MMFEVQARTYEHKHTKIGTVQPPTHGLCKEHPYTVYAIRRGEFLIWDKFLTQQEMAGSLIRNRKPGGWRWMPNWLFEPKEQRNELGK